MKKKKWSQSPASSLITLLISVTIVACTQAEAPNVDLIVEGEYIVTMDEDQTVVKGGAVAIKDGIIIELGPAETISAKYRASEHIKGDNRIVMPGLVNGHQHAAMTLLRGVADDLALKDWLTNYIFPAEVEFVVKGLADASIPAEQVSALAMAVVFKSMSFDDGQNTDCETKKRMPTFDCQTAEKKLCACLGIIHDVLDASAHRIDHRLARIRINNEGCDNGLQRECGADYA